MKTVFSGVAPSGTIHLGNYLGAIKNWVELQKDHQCIFCVVDLHAITVPQDSAKLRQKIMEVAAIYLAAGIDPEKSIVFIQSQNPDHVELAWILNTITKNGDLTKMIQLKEKANLQDLNEIGEMIDLIITTETNKLIDEVLNSPQYDIKEINHYKQLIQTILKVKGVQNIGRAVHDKWRKFKLDFNNVGIGLFDYPVLMASDILLYNTDVVPVGEDQKQHVELARTLARRFNQVYGETFKVPEAMVKKEGARIMGLDDPAKKMSKSASSPFNYIALTDSPDIIRKKIQKAVTDSGAEVKFDPQAKPAISNLLTIYSLVSGKTVDRLEKDYAEHTSYADFKKDLAEAIISSLSSFQKKYNELMENPGNLKKILENGAESAKKISNKTLTEAKNKIGLI